MTSLLMWLSAAVCLVKDYSLLFLPHICILKILKYIEKLKELVSEFLC